mgnify:CR=1 FL=1
MLLGLFCIILAWYSCCKTCKRKTRVLKSCFVSRRYCSFLIFVFEDGYCRKDLTLWKHASCVLSSRLCWHHLYFYKTWCLCSCYWPPSVKNQWNLDRLDYFLRGAFWSTPFLRFLGHRSSMSHWNCQDMYRFPSYCSLQDNITLNRASDSPPPESLQL